MTVIQMRNCIGTKQPKQLALLRQAGALKIRERTHKTRPEVILEGLFKCVECGKKRWVTGRSAGLRDGNPGRGRKCGCAGKVGLESLKRGGFQEGGPNSQRWKGGRSVRRDGYVLIQVSPVHPFACMGTRRSKTGWKQIFEHRLKMAEKLGRPLRSKEQVHHVDGDPTNNEIENLQLMSSSAQHMRLEHAERSKHMELLEKENCALKQENEELRCRIRQSQ